MKCRATPASSRLSVSPSISGLVSARVSRSIKIFVVGALLAGASLATSAATITSSSGFVNSSITTQTGTFTATFDASPSISPSNDILSFSSGAQTAFTGMAASVRFNTTGTIDARNGGAYAAASSIPFSAGKTYHFRMVINVANHTYSAFVTPAGGSELTVASNYAFRTEQAGITSINNFDADVDATPGGSLTYTTPTISGGSSSSSSSSSSVSSSSSSLSSISSSSSSISGGTTINSSNGFVNSAVANQTGNFTASFDASASVSPSNATLGFSSGAQTAYTGVAATVRFNTTGTIDARNAGAYAAVTSVPFSANTTYHFRMVINVAAKTYSAYVTAPGGSEQTLAMNYGFRTEVAGISNINNFNADVNATPGGSLTYTQPVISGSTSSSSSSSSSSVSSSSSSSTSSSSSSSSSKSSSSSSSSSGGLNPNAPPGSNFNLSGFTLQLPTGSSGNIDTVTGAQLAAGFTKSPYFYTDTGDGAMVMADPATGWTTSGSLHPRVELREDAIWATSGTNVMTNTVAVTKVPSHTTIGQIFQGTGPSKPLCELEVTSSGVVQLLLESTNQGGSSTMNTIASAALGTKFTYSMQLSGTTITIKVGSTTKTFTMDSSFNGESFYFKAGDYDQSAVSGTPATTASTIVKFYALSISH
ncbi:MAG: hypothetical protein JWN23_1973 [Rhodocyclales bacterium]|nr:hypothetical protein [Rhodocyclales bacterium]